MLHKNRTGTVSILLGPPVEWVEVSHDTWEAFWDVANGLMASYGDSVPGAFTPECSDILMSWAID